MNDLLYLLANEIDHLSKQFVSVFKRNEFWNFLPVIMLCSCDLPARADMQNFIGHNGKFACPYCYHPGLSVNNKLRGSTIRYVKHEDTKKLRKHADTILIAQRMADGMRGAIDNHKSGIKGYSAALMFESIDTIKSFPVDFMHGVLLGLKSIPNPPCKDYKIKSERFRLFLEKRINSLKPTCEFKRKPRSIFEISNFKASELMYLLWYYLRYALVGILPTPIVRHFEKLSVGSYMLCKKNVTFAEIRSACEMLKQYANEFEVMNLHLLNHYECMILNCGPLWSYNMFGFENKIGILKSFVTGRTDVLLQLAEKISRSLVCSADPEEPVQSEIEAYQPKSISVEQEWADILEDIQTTSSSGQRQLDIWRRIRLRRTIFTSQHAVATKSADFFLKLENGCIGKVVLYFGNRFSPNLLLERYTAVHQNHIWTEVEPSGQYEIHECEKIKEKLVYFHSGNIEYFTNMPYFYGKLGL